MNYDSFSVTVGCYSCLNVQVKCPTQRKNIMLIHVKMYISKKFSSNKTASFFEYVFENMCIVLYGILVVVFM